jgi:ABC-type nickel/cobalt efflux system permease component RcnA
MAAIDLAAAICLLIAAIGVSFGLGRGARSQEFLLGLAVAFLIGAIGIAFALNALGVLSERRSDARRHRT